MSKTKASPVNSAKRVAVMDLGTNTFHLLITEGPVDNYKTIAHEHIAVKLGEGGINHGLIQPEAFKRGIDTMQNFHRQIQQHNVSEVRAIATSALRSANNGKDFIDQVKANTGIIIETINGDNEAEFIYRGIQAAGCLSKEISLILDIGGGSVELILGNNEHIIYKQSFEIGAARLMEKFHRMDPIPNKAVYELNKYLEDKLESFFTAAKEKKIDKLIGSSGSFETFAEVIELDKGNPFNLQDIKHYTFNYNELKAVTDKLIRSSHSERAAHKGIIPIRVDMIVVASLLTRFVMNKLEIQNVVMSTSSLKEGVLAEMLG